MRTGSNSRRRNRGDGPQRRWDATILQAATRIFGEKGYTAARTADIAAAAGVTERTLFRYYPTKKALYDRVMAPAIVEAAYPRELAETGKLFADDSESPDQWERRILRTRLETVMRSASQFQLLLAAVATDAKMKRKVIKVWKEKILANALVSIRRFQDRGELRTDITPERIARAVISLNVSYLIACTLLAPEADWDHEAEIKATVDVLLNGIGSRK